MELGIQPMHDTVRSGYIRLCGRQTRRVTDDIEDTVVKECENIICGGTLSHGCLGLYMDVVVAGCP